MKLLKLDIFNFKSIIEETIEFNNDISFILGRNNVGKSILTSVFSTLKNIKIQDTTIEGSFNFNYEIRGCPL